MISRIAVVAALLIGSTAVRAQDTATPEMMQAALQAAIAQRDQALNEGIRLGAQLTLAQREIVRLRKELDEAKKPAQPQPPAEPAK